MASAKAPTDGLKSFCYGWCLFCVDCLLLLSPKHIWHNVDGSIQGIKTVTLLSKQNFTFLHCY